MPETGTAFLALWNDVEPARTAEYDAWHTFEHVPERVGIAGFLAGRRYVAAERTTDRYFTRYDLDAIAALDSAGYADVVAHPTPWSRSMRQSLSNFVRLPCVRRLHAGRGDGGALLTMRLDGRSSDAGIDALVREVAAMVEQGGLVAVDVGQVHEVAPFPLPNAGAEGGRGKTSATVTHVLLIDALDRAALAAVTPTLLASVEAQGMAIAAHAAYDLVFAVAPSLAGSDGAVRAAPREDLRRRWQP
jgi:hypothetical protein